MSVIAGPTPLEHLLVLIDESHDSERALPIAIRLAERMGAAIELLSVTSSARSTAVHEHVVELAYQADSPVESGAVIDGDDIPFEVGRRALSRPGSAIVMSGDGPRRSSGILTHSLTAELVADGLPIVVVGPEAVAHPSTQPIVACLDGSVDAEQVLPLAASWATALDVPLDLVVVARPRLAQVPDTPRDLEPADPDSGQVLSRAAGIVASTRPELEVRLHVATYPWSIADALSLYLQRHPAQLLAVATHVRTGWGRLIAPSTTARLVRQLTAPMLIVPISAPESSDSSERVEPAAQTGSGASAVACDKPSFNEIIVPLGPDEIRVDAVVATAAALAMASGAALTLITCEGLDGLREVHQRQREELSELLRPSRVEWRVVASTDVTETILAAAEASPDSIVCMATHAPGRVVDTVMPTVSGRIVRWSSRPVVLVGPHCVPPAYPCPEVVACVDGSLISEAVADLAGSWARFFETPVRIVEMYDPATMVDGAPPLAGRYADRLAARTARHHNVAARGDAVAGADPARAIRAWSEEHPGALLVMGSHGAGLSPQVLGGVVMDVVRQVQCPVVVVPAHAAGQSHVVTTAHQQTEVLTP